MAERDTAGSQGLTAGSQAVTTTPPPRLRMKDLPTAILQEMQDKLLNGQSSRDVRDWLTKQGYKFSHNAIAEYNAKVVRPALKISAQIQALQPVAESRDLAVIDQTMQVKEVTREVLSAAPLVARAGQLWSEVLGGVEDSKHGEPDLKARASLLNVGRGLIETEAKLLGVGAFGAQQSAGSGTTIQIAIATHRDNADPSIDICELKR
jgi:hypothetical protein